MPSLVLWRGRSRRLAKRSTPHRNMRSKAGAKGSCMKLAGLASTSDCWPPDSSPRPKSRRNHRPRPQSRPTVTLPGDWSSAGRSTLARAWHQRLQPGGSYAHFGTGLDPGAYRSVPGPPGSRGCGSSSVIVCSCRSPGASLVCPRTCPLPLRQGDHRSRADCPSSTSPERQSRASPTGAGPPAAESTRWHPAALSSARHRAGADADRLFSRGDPDHQPDRRFLQQHHQPYDELLRADHRPGESLRQDWRHRHHDRDDAAVLDLLHPGVERPGLPPDVRSRSAGRAGIADLLHPGPGRGAQSRKRTAAGSSRTRTVSPTVSRPGAAIRVAPASPTFRRTSLAAPP